MSSSAVKEGAGARSQVSNLVAWAATIVTLLFLTPLFTSLPEAVLAALIIHAVWHILTARKLLTLRKEAPLEVWFGVLALAGVVFIDVLQGMMIGLLASLAFVVYRSSRPHLSSLGRVPGTTGAYSDLTRHPENRPIPGVVIARLDGPMYYANALTARDRLKAMIREAVPRPTAVILDAEGQDELDLTSAEVLKGLFTELRASGIEVYAANVHAPVLERARATGLLEVMEADHILPTVELAVRAVEEKRREGGSP
jgi:MFS superfamily sulfate permease-like transporter